MRLLYALIFGKEADEMNISSNYASNMSMLFQSMYSTGNSGSSSMASLTNSVLGGSSATSGFYSSLSDYSLIKSGSYGKLLKVVTSNDIYEKLKAANAKKTETDKPVTETEDGKVVEKAEATDKTVTSTDSKTETVSKEEAVSKKEDYDVLEDLLSRNRNVSYTNTGTGVKDTIASSYNYAV